MPSRRHSAVVVVAICCVKFSSFLRLPDRSDCEDPRGGEGAEASTWTWRRGAAGWAF